MSPQDAAGPAAAAPDIPLGPVDPEPEELKILEGAARYRSYSVQVRNTARWLIGALAAVGAVLFGAGPVLDRPELSWSDNALQLVGAWLLGAIGLGGIAYLIATVATVFLPHEVSLATLPEELRKQIDDEPDHRSLPGGLGLKSVDQFRRALISTRRAVLDIEFKIGQAEIKANAATGAEKKKLTDEVAAMKAGLARTRAGLVILEDFRRELIERGTYLQDRRVWDNLKTPLRAGAVFAVIGTVGFPLALSTPPADEDADSGSSGASAATPTVTTMTKVAGTAGDALWNALALADCESSEGVVPVLLTGGKGTAEDPYKVQTLPTGACDPTSFTVISDVAVVDVTPPLKATITYEPTTSRGGLYPLP